MNHSQCDALLYKVFLLLLLFALSVSLTACSDKDKNRHNHPHLNTGKALYDFHCAPCHRDSGMGKILIGIPPLVYSKMTPEQIRTWVKNKADHEKMPVFSDMPDQELDKIINYIDSLRQKRG